VQLEDAIVEGTRPVRDQALTLGYHAEPFFSVSLLRRDSPKMAHLSRNGMSAVTAGLKG
jgi:hypothetical protein